MKSPPLLIQPGSMPVSASRLINKSLVVPKSWISTSLGRSRQIKPAVCHVVPAVKRAFSSKTARTPRRANWYSVLHPAEPPPKNQQKLCRRKFIEILFSHLLLKVLSKLLLGSQISILQSFIFRALVFFCLLDVCQVTNLDLPMMTTSALSGTVGVSIGSL
jgi:hypothetical protein